MLKKICIHILFILCSLHLFAQGKTNDNTMFQFNYSVHYDSILKATNTDGDPLNYSKLLRRFLENDENLTHFEVLALLIGFTDEKKFKPYQDIPKERQIYNLNEQKDFKKAVRKGKKFNRSHPLNQMTLIELAYAHYKLGDKEEEEKYSWRFSRIMDAMKYSGAGTHKDSAFFSLTPIDGQNFINKYLQTSIGFMGSTRNSDGHFIDVLEAKTDEFSITLYFNIQHAMKDLEKQFNLNKLDEDKKYEIKVGKDN